MYAGVSRNVSREEWMWRGLAIATILALVGMAVMPAICIGVNSKILYIADQTGFSKEHPYLTAFASNAAGGAASGAVAVIISDSLEGAEGGALVGGLIGAVAGAIVGAAVGVA